MRIIMMIVGALVLNIVVFGQSTQTPTPKAQEQQSTDILYDNIPVTRTIFYKRPEITMQRALQLADDYIEREKIDIAPYYLTDVRLVNPRMEKDAKQLYWLLHWVKADETFARDIHLYVLMDGTVIRAGSFH
jgi:hypothetical protein